MKRSSEGAKRRRRRAGDVLDICGGCFETQTRYLSSALRDLGRGPYSPLACRPYVLGMMTPSDIVGVRLMRRARG